jgi:hypothetical protein
VEDVAGAPGREHVGLQLRGGEVVALGEVAVGAPGGDAVGEGHPDAPVDVAAGMEVARVYRHTALDLVVLDAEHLDAELAGKAPGEPLLEELRRDLRPGQVRSSAEPS